MTTAPQEELYRDVENKALDRMSQVSRDNYFYNLGVKEALAKVEEWANTNKRTDDTQMSHDHVYDEALDDLLHHLQQLKDNTKTV